jgi:HEAT repeat protein
LIHDSNADARQAVAFALGQIDSDAAPAVPTLIKALVDVDDAVRKH